MHNVCSFLWILPCTWNCWIKHINYDSEGPDSCKPERSVYSWWHNNCTLECLVCLYSTGCNARLSLLFDQVAFSLVPWSMIDNDTVHLGKFFNQRVPTKSYKVLTYPLNHKRRRSFQLECRWSVVHRGRTPSFRKESQSWDSTNQCRGGGELRPAGWGTSL